MKLPWQTDETKLIDGHKYLVKMKHGLIQGYWSKDDGYFTGYYWQDITWYGTAWIPMEELE